MSLNKSDGISESEPRLEKIEVAEIQIENKEDDSEEKETELDLHQKEKASEPDTSKEDNLVREQKQPKVSPTNENRPFISNRRLSRRQRAHKKECTACKELNGPRAYCTKNRFPNRFRPSSWATRRHSKVRLPFYLNSIYPTISMILNLCREILLFKILDRLKDPQTCAKIKKELRKHQSTDGIKKRADGNLESVESITNISLERLFKVGDQWQTDGTKSEDGQRQIATCEKGTTKRRVRQMLEDYEKMIMMKENNAIKPHNKTQDQNVSICLNDRYDCECKLNASPKRDDDSSSPPESDNNTPYVAIDDILDEIILDALESVRLSCSRNMKDLNDEQNNADDEASSDSSDSERAGRKTSGRNARADQLSCMILFGKSKSQLRRRDWPSHFGQQQLVKNLTGKQDPRRAYVERVRNYWV